MRCVSETFTGRATFELVTPDVPPADGEVLAGLIERVTFHNEENGFCVLRVQARGHRDLVTVVGHAASIAAGEWITASGDWTNDRTHGLQFPRALPPAVGADFPGGH